MLNYRPSKSFVLAVACMVPLLVALYFGLMPELEAMRKPPVRGEITFSSPRPEPVTRKLDVSTNGGSSSAWSFDWLEENYENLMAWDRNPWKTRKIGFGDHYFDLLASKDPADIAKAQELRRLADALHQRLLKRYPELAISSKPVPPERNGLLKWLEFKERFSIDPDSPGKTRYGIHFPEDLEKHLSGQDGAWNKESAKSWLAQQKPLMDEIRAIGLMPEQSIDGIDVHRWAFISARLAKNCSDALLMEAHLAAEEGNVEAALESFRASNGIGAQIAQVETPSLLAVSVQILIQMQTSKYAFEQIMPALPPGQLDPIAWEKAMNPQVYAPSEFGRIMAGEWNVTAREYLLPVMVDTADPKYPPDPEALLDFQAGYFLNVVRDCEGKPVTDWPNLSPGDFPDDSHLSRQSRKVVEMLFIGARAWGKGMERSVSAAAMTQAAFAIMKGQPVPHDPVYGLPYRWDAANRKLSPPEGPAFNDMVLKPITVPKP